MSPGLHHECTRVPVTALLNCGPLLIVAEGPYLRFYDREAKIHLRSEQIFQAQAIHGISIIAQSNDHVNVVVWGGLLVRTLKLDVLSEHNSHATLGLIQVSTAGRAPDWILDLRPAPSACKNELLVRCAAVTAHNALLEVTIDHGPDGTNSSPFISVTELTSSSRSILYSAHLLWESDDRLLVAAGTAFGELIYWSWDRSRQVKGRSRIHRVFLGHEGSIFGVRISNKFNINSQDSRRLLASCSDDRTIRIWDVSDVAGKEENGSPDGDLELQRTRHTGFSNASFDTDVSNADCVAIGWGHTSRVWEIEFLDNKISTGDIFLVSAGEDATSRTWKLVTKPDDKLGRPDSPPWQLQLVDTAAYHNGKNIWSMSIPSVPSSRQVVLGGADSKVTEFPLTPSVFSRATAQALGLFQYNVEDIAASAKALDKSSSGDREVGHRSSKQAEFFRSYAFLDESSFILTTNSGKVYLETLSSKDSDGISSSKLVDQLEDLTGYSVCAGEQALGAAFIAGSKGSLYAYTKSTARLTKIHAVKGKIGEMFTGCFENSLQSKQMVLLITLVGQKTAHLLSVDLSKSGNPVAVQTTSIPIFDHLTGLAITSMAHADTSNGKYILLGFRRGSIAAYHIPDQGTNIDTAPSAELLKVMDSVHAKETVTALSWMPTIPHSPSGHLVSTGRDGCLAIHRIDLTTNTTHLVHKVTLPIGPNIEGLYIHHSHLHVYGFSSKEFVLYDTATEEEIMSVETGGAHRSWAFQPYTGKQGGGTLVWTRASSMHIRSQNGANHTVIRSGAHGREIKAVAVSPMLNPASGKRQLIATGAEDTDIKIFDYEAEHLVCRRTLRRHTTGIQCLQWSADGQYLFSSGGCEEFYIWRVRVLPAELGGIGVECEAVCAPESEHSDLRIMAFDVSQRSDTSFVISMVFSNSHVKVYTYNPHSTEDKWRTLSIGTYFTSCLTQCVFLPPHAPQSILTAGTDGHAVLWALPSSFSSTLTYHSPTSIHQSSSKTLASLALPNDKGTFVVSGGDDGTLAFLLASSTDGDTNVTWAHAPVILTRTHASAVTACVVLTHDARILVVTSGNDQWVRLWEVTVLEKGGETGDWAQVRRVGRLKTSVADVSSMAVLDGPEARVLICGVGMEIMRVEW